MSEIENNEVMENIENVVETVSENVNVDEMADKIGFSSAGPILIGGAAVIGAVALGAIVVKKAAPKVGKAVKNVASNIAGLFGKKDSPKDKEDDVIVMDPKDVAEERKMASEE